MQSSKSAVPEVTENFTRMLYTLEQEVVITAAKLSKDPACVKVLLENLQSLSRQLQKVLGSQYRIHVLLESAVPGVEINRNYRGCITLYSSTLLPDIEADVVGLSIAAAVMCETLEVAECVCVSDNSVRSHKFLTNSLTH